MKKILLVSVLAASLAAGSAFAGSSGHGHKGHDAKGFLFIAHEASASASDPNSPSLSPASMTVTAAPTGSTKSVRGSAGLMDLLKTVADDDDSDASFKPAKPTSSAKRGIAVVKVTFGDGHVGYIARYKDSMAFAPSQASAEAAAGSGAGAKAAEAAADWRDGTFVLQPRDAEAGDNGQQ